MTAIQRSRRLRWLVPVAVAGTIGLTALLPTLSAGAAPNLAPITAQQLIAKLQQAKVDVFSGTIALTANLGLPNLSSIQGQGPHDAFNPIELLSGTHKIDLAVDGPDRQRAAMVNGLGETDVYHDGADVWIWQSVGSKVTHKTL